MSDSHHEDRRAFIRRVLLSASLLAVPPNLLLANDEACTPTTRDYYGLGPYFREGAPYRQVMADVSEPGERLFVTGVVYANDCITPLRDIIIDVWHADDSGAYSSTTAGEYKLRTKLRSNESGAFAFETIKPGRYLNGAQYRPSHIHLKATNDAGTEYLITQLYFEGDPYNELDLGSNDPGAAARIIPLTSNAQGLHGVFDLVLNITPPADVDDVRGISGLWLRQNHPNPATSSTIVPFHLHRRTHVELAIFDMRGSRVRLLDRGVADSGAHAVTWDLLDDKGNRIPGGTYLLRLLVDGESLTRVVTVM